MTRGRQLRPVRHPRRMGAGVRTALGSALVAVLVAGCGTVTSPLADAGRPLPLTTAPGTAPATTSSPAPAPDCGDPRVSRRPPAVMPAPNAMPVGSYMEKIADRGYLRVGVLSDAPPFGSINLAAGPDGGQFEGFDIDIAKEIAKAIFGPDGADEAHLKFRALVNSERIPVIQKNEADIIVATMTTNCARRTQVDFSVPYYEANARVLVLKGSPYHGIEDLGGKKVCSAAGTTSLQHVADAASNPIPVGLPGDGDCLLALQNGDVEAISTDDTILIGMVQQDPRTEIVGGVLDTEPDAVAVSLDHPDLTRFVNGVLARVVASGRWDEIAQTWLGSVDPPLNPPPSPPTALYRD
ncbi:glutamate ABC transporter substrate-binding protein [Pseudofrankia sp. BMG5.36]|uniref:glutamate ABC transporter substrate-binding protein n=1 Tax=Pseudofrankia sp. BMG5.36 TaxID=1834512 RepID=UPI001F520F9A|nr:glutamate ABC transporter substrate-binding protein [Pseudofrankia sp. BMG5.36]